MKTTGWNKSAVLGLLLLAVCTGAAAQEKPGKLRSEMAKAEKEYVDLYNKVNTDPQFAIICQPRYLMRAREKSATERMQAAVAAGDSTGSANTRGPNVGAASAGGSIST